MSDNKETRGHIPQSVLETLYELWIENDPACNDEVRRCYKEIGEHTAELSAVQRERIGNMIADLCVIYSHRAYLDGLRTGGSLILELLSEAQGNPLLTHWP